MLKQQKIIMIVELRNYAIFTKKKLSGYRFIFFLTNPAPHLEQ
jgi:hypothetical protein